MQMPAAAGFVDSVTKLSYKTMPSPVGELKLVASGRGLAAVLLETERTDRVRLQAMSEDPAHPVLVATQRQLEEYFAGARRAFDLPLDARGTDFQQRVWDELRAIPFGQTRSYGELAKRLGDANLMRAVGAANGSNPISIIVPCHRVIGASGKLVGYAGGLKTKAYLLDLESGRIALI
jgi:methylated-DNA-[protein]-cysteine S-methyltransferase